MPSPTSKRIRALRDRWRRLPGNARGAAWMLLASLAFSAMAASMKFLGQTLGVWQMVVLRTAVALVVISPLAIRAGPRVLVTRRPAVHVLRSCLGMGGMICFYLAVTHLELALATSLSFSRTLFMIVLAVAFLGEVIRWRRSAATLVGFMGVIVCVQPSPENFNPWTLVSLAGALFAAGVTTVVKRLTQTETPLTIMLWTYLVMGAIAAVPAAFVWRTPTLDEMVLVVLMGVFSAVGQTSMVYGLQAGEATAVTPFDYTRLLYAALFGYLLFGDVPTASTWLGAAIIVGSTLYIAVREARLRAAGRA